MHEKAQEAVKKVVYEWRMLMWVYEQAGGKEFLMGTAIGAEHESMFLECFILHARVLRDFFRKSRTKNGGAYDDDILAEDFFDDPNEWHGDNRPELGEYIASRKQRFDKALAHLSYERLEFEKLEKAWDCTTIGQELEVQWNAFLEALPEDRRNWFLAELEN